VALSWSGPAIATRYELERRNHGAWQWIASPAAVSYTDTECPGGACVYRVRAIASGGDISAYSRPDLAYMTLFTTIVPYQTRVAADHFEELLVAINAIRYAAGQTSKTWAQMLPSGIPAPAIGGTVRAAHLLALRSEMDAALSANSITLQSYTDSLAQPTWIKAVHLTELQERTK
jgi:hypothetical protein